MNNMTTSLDNLLSQSVQLQSQSSPYHPPQKRHLESMHSGFYSQGAMQSCGGGGGGGNMMNTSVMSVKERDATSSSQKNLSPSS